MNNKLGINLPLNKHLIPFPNHLDRPINLNNNNNTTKNKFDKLSHEQLLNISELNILKIIKKN